MLLRSTGLSLSRAFSATLPLSIESTRSPCRVAGDESRKEAAQERAREGRENTNAMDAAGSASPDDHFKPSKLCSRKPQKADNVKAQTHSPQSLRGPCESHTGGVEGLAADASGKKKKKRAVTTSKRAAIAAVFAVVVIVETSSNPALSDGMSDGRFSRGAARPLSEV